MSVTIRWKIPTDLVSGSSYGINVYRSVNGENGDYSLIGTATDGTVRTYTDSDGSLSYFYFVRYSTGGTEGSRVLAVHEAGVTEQRLAEQINGKLPEIIKARVDSDLIDIRKAMINALAILNSYTPITNYGLTNLPAKYETGIVIFTLALLYMEHHLQIAMRDYSYGGTGITLAVDRGSKISAAVTELTNSMNTMLAQLKFGEWPDGIGLGSEAMGMPQARIMSSLYNR